MSTHLGGPRGSAEVTRARTEHREREKRREKEPKLERLPGHDALIHFLQRMGRGEDCTDEMHCNPERYEPKLMADLYMARRSEDDERLREVREVIWAGSWRTHQSHDPMHAARLTSAIKSGLEHEQSEEERINPQDAKDQDEPIQELEMVVTTLRELKTGDDVESALRIIEDWYYITLKQTQTGRSFPRLREKAKKELEVLRLIRDELLYARLFPLWTQIRNDAMRQTLKKDV